MAWDDWTAVAAIAQELGAFGTLTALIFFWLQIGTGPAPVGASTPSQHAAAGIALLRLSATWRTTVPHLGSSENAAVGARRMVAADSRGTSALGVDQRTVGSVDFQIEIRVGPARRQRRRSQPHGAAPPVALF